MHSPKYKKVKGYYDSDLWGESRVRNAVTKGWITEEEFQEITGIPFNEAAGDPANGGE